MISTAYENEIRAITLEVRETNLAAQKLYDKFGFQRHGFRKNYYEDNRESALILWTEDLDNLDYMKFLTEGLKLKTSSQN